MAVGQFQYPEGHSSYFHKGEIVKRISGAAVGFSTPKGIPHISTVPWSNGIDYDQ